MKTPGDEPELPHYDKEEIVCGEMETQLAVGLILLAIVILSLLVYGIGYGLHWLYSAWS